MAVGERNKNGKPTDIVSHYVENGFGAPRHFRETAFCGRKKPGYITHNWTEVTCLKCIAKSNKKI